MVLPHALALLALLPHVPGSGEGRLAEVAGELDRWLARMDAGQVDPGGELGRKQAEWLDERVDDLVRTLRVEPKSLTAVATELLDLAGFSLTRMPERSFFVGGGALAEIRSRGLRPLQGILDGTRREELLDWLVRGVLAEPRQNPVPRRWIALYCVSDQDTPLIDHVVLGVARDRDDPLRPDALAELAGRSSAEIDRFLVANLTEQGDPDRDPHAFNLLASRLKRGPLDDLAAGALLRSCKTMMLSRDWREASRALELGRALDPMRAAPMMIEALHSWTGRTERGSGSRRIVYELTSELQRVSGRSIGPNPTSWTTWWGAVRSGSIPLFAPGDDEPRSKTDAVFFGLRPVSDRVTFIIDHSGSMQSEWGSTGHSRYVEAIDQLLRFLQASGEDTLFNIVLFDTLPIVSTPKLVAATPENLERARSSLVQRTPNGGTNLRGAVEHALKLDGSGRVDLDRLEADTIVVLCDGMTNSGPGWVRTHLAQVRAVSRIVFHCVLIGAQGDGTLEELAERTGGEFLRSSAPVGDARR